MRLWSIFSEESEIGQWVFLMECEVPSKMRYDFQSEVLAIVTSCHQNHNAWNNVKLAVGGLILTLDRLCRNSQDDGAFVMRGWL
jgi:hypothetical protein